MRAACHKYLQASRQPGMVAYGGQSGHWASWHFLSSLGELRGVAGIHIAKLAVKYKIDVEDQLALIFPEEDLGETRPVSPAKTARLNR